MNKEKLIEKLAKKTDSSKALAEECLEIVLEEIKKSVVKGEKVNLVGFGTFTKKTRRARKGRDPRTGKEIDIPEKSVPAFSSSKKFKKLVSERG